MLVLQNLKKLLIHERRLCQQQVCVNIITHSFIQYFMHRKSMNPCSHTPSRADTAGCLRPLELIRLGQL